MPPAWRIHFRRPRTARVLLMALRHEHRYEQNRTRLITLLIAELLETLQSGGYVSAEWSWTLEDNHKINRAVGALGARHYKTYRIYEKALSRAFNE
jgi:hypothetical protein